MIISKHDNEKQKAELLHLAFPGNDSSPIKSIWSSHTAVVVSKKSHVIIGVSASTVKMNSFVTCRLLPANTEYSKCLSFNINPSVVFLGYKKSAENNTLKQWDEW